MEFPHKGIGAVNGVNRLRQSWMMMFFHSTATRTGFEFSTAKEKDTSSELPTARMQIAVAGRCDWHGASMTSSVIFGSHAPGPEYLQLFPH
jgi:hypothetical protein